MIVRCKICGLILTNDLIELGSLELLNENDNEDYILKNHFVLGDGEFYKNSKSKIIINIADLINSKNHSEYTRLNGCCGLDGMDGLNKTCINGHEVGTEYSDCWMPHSVIFENDLIVIEN